MGLFKVRRNLYVKGTIISEDGINQSAYTLRVPHTAGSVTVADLANNGQIHVGFDSSDNLQLGFVVNGTPVVFKALAGTGAVTAEIVA